MLGIPYACTLTTYDRKIMNGLVEIKRKHTEYVNAFYRLRNISPEHNYAIEDYLKNISIYLREHLLCYRRLEAIFRKGALTIICPFLVLPSGKATNVIQMGKYYDSVLDIELSRAEKKIKQLRIKRMRSSSMP